MFVCVCVRVSVVGGCGCFSFLPFSAARPFAFTTRNLQSREPRARLLVFLSEPAKRLDLVDQGIPSEHGSAGGLVTSWWGHSVLDLGLSLASLQSSCSRIEMCQISVLQHLVS